MFIIRSHSRGGLHFSIFSLQVHIAEELESSCLFVTNKLSQSQESEEKIKEIFFFKEARKN